MKPVDGMKEKQKVEAKMQPAGLISYPKISIIIPIGPTEKEFGRLVDDLALLPSEPLEIIVVSCVNIAELTDKYVVEKQLSAHELFWVKSEVGRAQQMNAGAEKATGDYLWFVHLDSHFDANAFAHLHNSIQTFPQALHYFRLGWCAPSPSYMKLNALGANLRSRWFGTPFGDQGFCLAKTVFNEVGGYSTEAPYGEDHLLTWKIRQFGCALREVPATLWTSPRKYAEKGWVKLTCLYQWLWVKQAIPEAVLLIKKRIDRTSR